MTVRTHRTARMRSRWVSCPWRSRQGAGLDAQLVRRTVRRMVQRVWRWFLKIRPEIGAIWARRAPIFPFWADFSRIFGIFKHFRAFLAIFCVQWCFFRHKIHIFPQNHQFPYRLLVFPAIFREKMPPNPPPSKNQRTCCCCLQVRP